MKKNSKTFLSKNSILLVMIILDLSNTEHTHEKKKNSGKINSNLEVCLGQNTQKLQIQD
jgi:hypothetical protein